MSLFNSFLQIILSWFFGLLFENWFGITFRIKRLIALLLNKKADIQLVLSFDLISETTIEDVEKVCLEYFNKKNKRITILQKTKENLKISDGYRNIFFYFLQDNSLILETSKMESGIRQIPDNFFDIMHLVEEIENSTSVKLKHIDTFLTLPTKRINLNLRVPKSLRLKDYKIELTDREGYSKVEIKMDKIKLFSDSQTSIDKVIKQLISPF